MNGNAISVFTEWVDQYLNFEKLPQKNIFWLDTMNFIASKLGNPQNGFKSFHVAGSKGKGSVSLMLSNILEEQGLKTGLYSSPHILNFVERVGSVKGPFEEAVYERSVKEIMNTVNSIVPDDFPGQRPVTWFELVTAFSFLCFKNAGCSWAVYEVGLGGRLDATNIIKPQCCCIGPIEKEHVEYLGDTLEKIAAEKGGIIKENTPVIIGPQPESVKAVFREIAASKNAPVVFTDEVCSISSVEYSLEAGRFLMKFSIEGSVFRRPLNFKTRMCGEFQARNAALAAIAAKTVFPDLDEAVIERAIDKSFLPARFEIQENVPGCSAIPYVVMDGAHTVNSIHFTMDTFKKFQSLRFSDSTQEEKPVLLYASAADKDVEDIVPYFKDCFDSIFLTKPGETKAADMPRLENAFKSCGLDYTLCSDWTRAIDAVLKHAQETGRGIIVTGSFYLVAEFKKQLLARKCTSVYSV